MLRRIRGAVGMGLIWAVAWSFVGGIPRWVLGFNADAPFPLIFGLAGFVAGILFSLILALTAGRRRFDDMSLPRFAAWGAIVGVLFSAVVAATLVGWGSILLMAPSFAVACALSATGSLSLARRAQARELPNNSSPVAALRDMD